MFGNKNKHACLIVLDKFRSSTGKSWCELVYRCCLGYLTSMQSRGWFLLQACVWLGCLCALATCSRYWVYTIANLLQRGTQWFPQKQHRQTCSPIYRYKIGVFDVCHYTRREEKGFTIPNFHQPYEWQCSSYKPIDKCQYNLLAINI